MILIILTVVMGIIIALDNTISNSSKTKRQIEENERIGKAQARQRMNKIEQEAKERAEYWAKTGLPFHKWK